MYMVIRERTGNEKEMSHVPISARRVSMMPCSRSGSPSGTGTSLGVEGEGGCGLEQERRDSDSLRAARTAVNFSLATP